MSENSHGRSSPAIGLSKRSPVWFLVLLSMVRCFALLCLSQAIYAETLTRIPDYTHVSWGRQDGAPTSVVALAQTKDRLLWLGSEVGLFRFDGVRFDRYPSRPGEPALLSKNVACLWPDNDGGLWIGFGTGGIAHLRGNALRVYGKEDGLYGESTDKIEVAPDGSVWAIADGRLMRLTGDHWENFGIAHGLNSTSLYAFHFDHVGGLWVSEHRTIWHLPGGAKSFEKYPTDTLAVYQFFDGPDGAVWIADAWRSIRPVARMEPRLPLKYAAQGLFLRDGELWVAMNYPAVVQAHVSANLKSIEVVDAYTNASAPGARVLLADDAGNVFVGTNGGLDRFEPSFFRRYRKTNIQYYPSIATTSDGSLWIGGHDVPVVCLKDGTTSESPLGHGMGPIFVDSHDRVWMQDARKHTIRGLLRNKVVDLPSPLPNDPSAAVQSMAEDIDGSLLVSFDGGGLWRYTGGWQKVENSRLPNETVLSMLRASDGKLWLGYRDNTLARIDRNEVTVFTRASGIQVGSIVTLYESEGTIWLGGADGVAFLRDRKFRMTRLLSTERAAGTSGIIVDDERNLWLNTENGVVRIRTKALKRLLEDDQYRAPSDLFTEHQGIRGTPAQMRPLPSALRDRSGRLWFATIDNLVSYDSESGRIPRPSANPRVIGVSMNGTYRAAQELTNGIQARGVIRKLSFDYLAVSLSAGERVTYRYRLEGVDRDWQEAGDARHASYMRLSPGTYRFRVMASNGYGMWQESSQPMLVRVTPVFYQTRTFLILSLTTGIALVLMLVRLRVSYATSRMRRRGAAELAERERIAHVLHDTLLQGVQGLLLSVQAVATEFPEQTETRVRMERILDRTQEVLEEGRNSVHELRSAPVECDGLLDALLQIANGFEHSAMRVNGRIEGVERPLVPEICADAFYVCKEAILNALLHSGGTSLLVSIQYGRRDLLITISDNGRGIPTEVLQDGLKGHWGILGMRERARDMHATLRYATANTRGTKVTLRVRANIAYIQPHQSLQQRLRSALRG